MDEKAALNFFFELGMLRRNKREGWRVCGVEAPESIADHSLRAAQIGYVLALLEGYPKPEEVAAALVFHEIGECRVGDAHSISKMYGRLDEGKAAENQLSPLGKEGRKIMSLWKLAEHNNAVGGVIAKDADWLECAITAREYMDAGHAGAEEWIVSVERAVRTKSAKKLVAALRKSSPKSWWLRLQKEWRQAAFPKKQKSKLMLRKAAFPKK